MKLPEEGLDSRWSQLFHYSIIFFLNFVLEKKVTHFSKADKVLD